MKEALVETRAGDAVPRRFALGASAQDRTAIVDSVALAYDDRGNGFPLVGLHAIAHGSRDFELVADALSRNYRLITLDWPGHGRSDPDHKPASAQRYAEVLGGFLDAVGIECTVLIGNSIGGAAAIRFAARHPNRVHALVLANPGGLAAVGALGRRFCGAMTALGRAGNRRAFYFKPLFGLLYRQILRSRSSFAQRGRIVDASFETSRVWEEAWRSFAEPSSDLTPMIPQIRSPVLLTWAMKDRIVSFARSKRGIESFSNHKFVPFSGGHCAFLEDPERFVSVVEDFLGASCAINAEASAPVTAS